MHFSIHSIGRIFLVGIPLTMIGNLLVPKFFGVQHVLASDLREERQLFETLPGSNKDGSILDIQNPMELMNTLRRATAMEDATSPSDAIDEALKAFESQSDELIVPETSKP